MALLHLPIETITEAQLGDLIQAKAAESLHIEYKRQTYGGGDGAHREFLADVSSFANARGGDLLIGVEAAKGVPSALSAFAGNADAELLRLDNMARGGLEPRISNLQMRAVPIAAGGSVLVIRIPRSYRGPHRVIFGGSNKFHARSSIGKYEPNVDELRAMFAFAPELAERMRAFRFSRVASIAAGDTPAALQGNLCLVLHVVPFSHFDLRPSLSLPKAVGVGSYFIPIGTTHAADSRINIDGFLTLSNPNDTGQHRAYVQVFRPGAVEAVACLGEHVEIRALGVDIVRHARLYTTALQECDAEPPFMVMASILGTKDKRVAALDNYKQLRGQVADRDQLHLTEVVLEETPNGNPNCGLALKPLLDHLANAAGLATSPSFDQEGNCLIHE